MLERNGGTAGGPRWLEMQREKSGSRLGRPAFLLLFWISRVQRWPGGPSSAFAEGRLWRVVLPSSPTEQHIHPLNVNPGHVGLICERSSRSHFEDPPGTRGSFFPCTIRCHPDRPRRAPSARDCHRAAAAAVASVAAYDSAAQSAVRFAHRGTEVFRAATYAPAVEAVQQVVHSSVSLAEREHPSYLTGTGDATG